MGDTSTEHRTWLLRYLDYMREGYPYGIPRELLVEHKRTASSPVEAKEFYFIAITQSGGFSDGDTALLDAIISKGLKLELDQTARETLTEAADCTAAVQRCVLEHSPKVIVVFGVPDPDGQHERIAGSTVLYTHSLREISESTAIKKGFWRELQFLQEAQP